MWSAYGVGAFGRSMDSGVDHNDAIFVIDRQGRERELVHSDIAVGDFVKDLRALVDER